MAGGHETHPRAGSTWLRVLRRARGPVGWTVIGATVMLLLVRLVPGLAGDRLEHGELVILSGRDDSIGGQRQKLIDEWNRMHPDSPARIEELSPNADVQHSEMIANAQAGGGRYDVYNLDVTWIAEFAAGNYIRPLDVDTDGFLPQPLDTCRYAGKLWALPFNTDAGLLYYRTDLVDPTHLPTVLPPPRGYTLPRPDPVVAAYAGQFADYEGLTVNALETIWKTGGDVLRGDDVAIDTAQEALGRLAQADLSSARSYDETETTTAFLAGRIAMMRNWPVQYSRIQDAGTAPGAPQMAVRVAQHFDIAPLPGPSVLGGQDLAVASDTGQPRAAQALVEFLTSEDSQLTLFKEGGLPATRGSVYHEPSVQDRRPYATDLLNAVKAARQRPVTPHYTLFSKTFREIISYALANHGQLKEGAVRSLTDALKGQLD